MRERKDTRIHLVAELESLPRNMLIDKIIAEAKAGEFHDYKNQKYTCGKVALVSMLLAAGLQPLATRVIDGEFDEEADEEDIENMRKFAPKEMWPVLGLDCPKDNRND